MGSNRSSRSVAIVDYGLGNLFSIQQACKHVGLEAQCTDSPDLIEASDAVILPGIGAFATAMTRLNDLGLADVLRSVVDSGKPTMGICLGMQLLFERSYEFGRHDGLGLLPGEVVPLSPSRDDTQTNSKKVVKVPQVGWNRISLPDNAERSDWDNSSLRSLKDGCYMYFVHSYCVQTDDMKSCLATTDYGGHVYTSAVQKENLVGVQFHPERSGEDGLTIYRSFCASIQKN